jgi:hypothetical protein
MKWIVLILCLILLFGPAICFWLVSYIWEKSDENSIEDSKNKNTLWSFDECSYKGSCLTDCTYRAECPYYSY